MRKNKRALFDDGFDEAYFGFMMRRENRMHFISGENKKICYRKVK